MQTFVVRAATAGMLALAPAALATQGDVARLEGVEGNVLVSHAESMSSVNEGHAVVPGARVLLTANSRVTVRFANGCGIQLQPGMRYEVSAPPTCRAPTQGMVHRGALLTEPHS